MNYLRTHAHPRIEPSPTALAPSFRERVQLTPGPHMALDQRVSGVHKDIQENLCVFIGIAVGHRVVFRLLSNDDILVLEDHFDERERMSDHLINARKETASLSLT